MSGKGETMKHREDVSTRYSALVPFVLIGALALIALLLVLW